MPHEVSGTLLVLVGMYLFVCGRRKSKGTIYGLLVARARILWGDKVHAFFQIAGAMVILFGISVASGLFQRFA